MGMTILGLLLLSLANPASAAWPAFKSGPGRPAFLELYSSEGCSSCPPADAWASSLKDRPGLWSEFVPVVFHVDYWDYLGWKDVLASPQFARRQQLFGRLVTPGFVLNGEGWWRRDAAKLKRVDVDAGMLSVEPQGLLKFKVKYAGPEGSLAHVALLGFGVETEVASGENEGERLKHDFAAVAYGATELVNGQAVVTLKPHAKAKPASFGVAAWVSGPGSPKALQIVGGFLPGKP
jgi:hypothetical protein